MSIWGKKPPGSFASSSVFGPIARNNPAARNETIAVFDFSKSNYTGKHVKATWSGDALLVNTDGAALTVPVAIAGVEVIRSEILGISRTIAPSTARARATAARAYAAGKPWALERYKDRRPGAAGSDQLYNDSGSLAAKVRIVAARSSANIVTQIDGVRHSFVVAHNLKQLVPALKSGLGRYPAVQKALSNAAKANVRKVSQSRAAEGLGHQSVFGKRGLGGRAAEKVGRR